MMDLLGAGNPYIRRYAEGGEAQQLGPLDYAWNRLVQDQWAKEEAAFQAQKADYQKRVEEANLAAASAASEQARARLQSAMDQATRNYAPEVQQLQSNINDLERLLRGEISSATVRGRIGKNVYRAEDLRSGAITPNDVRELGIAPLQQKLSTLTNPNVVKNEALRLLVEEGDLKDDFGSSYLYALQSTLPGAKDTKGLGSSSWAQTQSAQLRSLENAFLNRLSERYRPTLEDSMVRPILSDMEKAATDFSAQANRLHGGYDTTVSQAVKDLYTYNRTRNDEIERELSGLRETGSYTPEMDEIIRRAREAEGQYLFGPEYTYTPEGQQRGREIYQSVFEEGLRNRPILIPSTPTTPTSPTAPVDTGMPSVPTQPPPTSVPVPVIGQRPTTPTPSTSPVGNLTPQPLPGITAPPSIGGIPQPSVGYQPSSYQSIFPSYQSPTTQATQPTNQQQQPQQQIQYGPIGQGAVGQTNLLNTLLANQQDPTKVSLLGFDNPYLMKPFG